MPEQLNRAGRFIGQMCLSDKILGSIYQPTAAKGLITLVKKPSRPMPLQFCKSLIVDMTSFIIQGMINIEIELGFGKLSKIEIVLETECIWEAKVRSTFTKKSLKFETMTLGSFVIYRKGRISAAVCQTLPNMNNLIHEFSSTEDKYASFDCITHNGLNSIEMPVYFNQFYIGPLHFVYDSSVHKTSCSVRKV